MAGRELLSPRSTRVKAARRLAKRAFRHQQRRFLAEGPQAVREALATPGVTHDLFTTHEATTRCADLIEAAERADIEVHLVGTDVLADITQTVTPQGLVAVCEFIDTGLADVLAGRPGVVTVLAHVRDPGNAGTVLRTADAAGSGAVVFTDASVDPYNGKCVRASAGSLFHVPVVTGVKIEQVVAALTDAGYRVLAADGSGDTSLDELTDRGGLAGPTGWVFGNEAWGLPADIVELADQAVAVPIYGRAESLNLATAAAVCLYASARAQRVAAR